jgi:IS66 Orf2 like protein
MIDLTEDMRILVAVKPAHFRCGIDGLSGLCRSVLNENPRSGIVFVFRNRSGGGGEDFDVPRTRFLAVPLPALERQVPALARIG